MGQIRTLLDWASLKILDDGLCTQVAEKKIATHARMDFTFVIAFLRRHLFALKDVCTPGGTPLYGLYRYVRPQRVWFFSRFGHK